jgi:hypothetical protein
MKASVHSMLSPTVGNCHPSWHAHRDDEFIPLHAAHCAGSLGKRPEYDTVCCSQLHVIGMQTELMKSFHCMQHSSS